MRDEKSKAKIRNWTLGKWSRLTADSEKDGKTRDERRKLENKKMKNRERHKADS